MASNVSAIRYTSERTTVDKRLVQEQILEMRTGGMSFDNIAKAMGYSKRYVYKLYEEAINAIITPGVEQLRKQEGERLDAMMIPVMAKIMEARNKALIGDMKYEAPIDEIKVALAISDSRTRLFGLNVATKGAVLPLSGPLELAALNLTTMSETELAQFRDLLGKAMPAEDPAHGD